ncbi:LysR family transcriptional regulator [Aquabacterium sp. J223]|uniref:LysR family transcriptional regulator n=1 Tax=Aquabacterium sp. J223 TaxID=2898431 RepID=UPI0021AE0C2B|nr:LysR family transcriptional regulator [Aquabacterium sp. J223]UUX94623.1 LysR family transcriptional regulator [Aquabacterium sp. J223]
MNLKVVQLLARTAALGSISAAAAEMGMSSSLASRHLAALERELGARLLQRTTRSLKVTPAGEQVVRWAQAAMADYSAMRDALGMAQGRPAGLVRVACTEYLAHTVVADVLADFALRYPLIEISLLTTDRAVQLSEGQVDLALHVGAPPDSNVAVRRLREVRTVLCASPAYLAERGTPTRPEDLVHHRCLAHSTYEPVNWFFRRSGELLVHALRPHVTTNSTSTLHQLALRGVGIARLSGRLCAADLSSGALRSLLPDCAQTLANGELPSVWMIFPDRHLLQRVRLVADAITQRTNAVP